MSTAKKKAETSSMAMALAQFQMQADATAKSGTNPHFRAAYSTLQDVIEVVREGTQFGLCYTQVLGVDEYGEFVKTILMHESGETIESRVSVKAKKDDAQGMGSGITYARRYGLAAIYGIAPDDDDDGNAAVASLRSNSGRNAPPPSNTQLPDPPKADLSPSNAKIILGLIKQGKVEEARKLIKVHKRTKDQDAQFKAAFDAASKPKPPVPEEDFQKALSLISEGDADGARNLLKPFTLHPDQVEMLRMTEVSYNDANALLGAAIETPKGK